MNLSPPPEPAPPPWGVADLIAFGSFFLITLIFLPTALVAIVETFRPDVTIRNLSAESQILLQGALDIAWVGFIFFLVKVIHRRKILESIRWFRTRQFRPSNLIALGATLATTVLVVPS